MSQNSVCDARSESRIASPLARRMGGAGPAGVASNERRSGWSGRLHKVVFVGLGAMGEPMAANLLGKGFSVTVVRHRRAEAVARLAAAGATVAETLAEAVRDCDAVVLSLPGSKQVEAVLLGASGIAESAPPGTIVIDCTTSNPSSTARLSGLLRERDLGFVAAGMTRGVAGARQGKLAFFIGGEPDDVERAKLVLDAVGDTYIPFRSAREAHAAKLISNVLSYASVALVSEALGLGMKAGVDLTSLHAALMEGAPSRALEAFGTRMVAGEYDPPRVTIEHACEDMIVAREAAADAGSPMSLLEAADAIYRLSQAQGKGGRDISAIAQTWREEDLPATARESSAKA